MLERSSRRFLAVRGIDSFPVGDFLSQGYNAKKVGRDSEEAV